MFPERRNRLIKILISLAVWPAAVLAAAVVGFSAYAVLGLAPLAPWHSLDLKEEFEARRDAQLDFAGLLALEGRLFEELRRAKVLRSSDLAEERSSRFSPASWVARLTGAPADADSGEVYTAPYNRSFELVPAERRGSALLIHGLTDAPYSMLALARRLQARGLHVVVLRLPGHGTVPAGQLRMTLEDWRAAVRIAARHAASLAAPDPSNVSPLQVLEKMFRDEDPGRIRQIAPKFLVHERELQAMRPRHGQQFAGIEELGPSGGCVLFTCR